MDNKRNYYDVLGVKKESSDIEIKKAYRKLCKEHHPDKGGDEEQFKNIAEAYETLSDGEKRKNYDNFGHNQQRNRVSREQYYHQAPQRVGEHMQLLIKITLEEVYTGVKKRYKYNRTVSCETCSGHGGTDADSCTICGGSGVIMHVLTTPIGQMRQTFPCQACEGTGLTYNKKCTTCNSSGIKTKEEVIEVDIPSGVQEGMIFIMGDKGHAIKGGINGDLHISIMELKHSKYVRNGSDLKTTIKLSYPQLVLGDKIDIITIDGGKIRFTIPAHSEVGSDLRIKDKGLKQYNKDTRGDVIVILGIDIPKELDDDTKALIIDLKEKLK